MPLLFSYGTLQDPAVQIATFGRRLEGRADALSGFDRGRVPVAEPDVAATGRTHHDNVVVTGHSDSRIGGVALEVTDAELVAADAYEAPADYVRIAVTLVSGASAWVYVHGPSRPPE